MTLEAWEEQAARIIDPSSWAVMDSYLKQMLRKYKGQNIGYDPDAFKHKPSMAIAEALWPLVQQAIAAEREALNGYRAAVAFISADSWDGCSDCIEILKAARNADLHHDLTDPNDVAENLKRIRLHGATAIRSLKESDNGAG